MSHTTPATTEEITTEITSEEIKKEFQLERMILFSDAVFAIVITLMAIEIKIPESDQKLTNEILIHEMLRLLPVIFAYVVSFFFIGAIWYRHLQIFSIVKDYDLRLVKHNLSLLFFVGLFPFSASVITHSKGAPIAFFIYLGIICACTVAQFLLYQYIVSQPKLRLNIDLAEHHIELKKRRVLAVGLSIVLLFTAVLYYLLPAQEVLSYSPLTMLIVIIIYRLTIRNINKQKR